MTDQTSRPPVDPNDFTGIIGSSFAKREHSPILMIGKRGYNRWQLGRLGCPHPMAAAHVNRVLQQLRISSLQSLADHAQELGNYKGLGVTAYWLVLAILSDAGFNIEEVHGDTVTYDTVKRRALRTLAKQPKPRKRRAGPPSQSSDVN